VWPSYSCARPCKSPRHHKPPTHADTSRNSTVLNHSVTYWGAFEEISAQNNAHLNVLERLWAAWYLYIGDPTLATGLLSFGMHEIVYFGRSLPWIIIDRIAWFNRYKIQNVRSPNDSLINTHESLAQDSHLSRTMAVRFACPTLPLYRRITSDLAFSSLSCIFRNRHHCSLSLDPNHGRTDRRFLYP
jgi:hypothetical protein